MPEEYVSRGRYRNWGLWQLNTRPDYVGNMSLEMSVKGVDLPDLKADIDEHMRSRLSAFERSIRSGSKPRVPAARRVVVPTPWRAGAR